MKDVLYLGIDPGAGGGLAALYGDSVETTKMPARLEDLWSWLSDRVRSNRYPLKFVALEKVGGYIRRSTAKSAGGAKPGAYMFTFGTNFGALLMSLTALELYPDYCELVHPARWQKALSISPRRSGEGRGAWKSRLKDVAQELFPQIRITLATADALLLAEYCRRRYAGFVAFKG